MFFILILIISKFGKYEKSLLAVTLLYLGDDL
jgi:hypothetical protein